VTVPLILEERGGGAPGRTGMQHAFIAPYGAFATADGEIVLAIQNEREWQSFCKTVLLQPALADDPRFDSNQRRVEHKVDLTAEIGEIFGALPRGTVVERLDAARIAYGALNSVADLSQHPQLRRAAVETPGGGTVSIVAPPGRDDPDLGAIPALGSHSQSIRDEFE
jgi:itaconate CoA-transferase